ncbi:hypothetical protein GUITHDRAFT_148085 [Guillardia theta CCMP2712]|uniref:DUF5672 domain-containing protein n=2 Tax=Guillardia theta TaxID=55529 RepID=L1IBJ6_GUITC|nr:hypothetical protein GUITHDRAFT_148085 [Guillardia theta CCMP2712]EKX33215.1 hypothetical protein GUITHDRAFT_148085 [Guillardia theta CCMP2712]|eukprot:XP_005820195.1 hypothetical protein GUITHDRAFT_148085 [Guillardia theta CCMP2712]
MLRITPTLLILLLPSCLAFPVYRETEKDSLVAVCVISDAREVAGLKVALSTILSAKIKNVQIFTLEWIENAIAESIGAMITLFGTESVRIVRMPNEYLTHHGYSMLLKDEKFWWACDGEWVLIFQADSILCLGSDARLDEFMLYDYIGAPFLPGECPSGHDKDRSMCQDDFDKMATHAGLKIPEGVGGNGGFSLRRRSKMIEMCQTCGSSHPFYSWNEDIFFSYPCDNVTLRLPSEPVARRFSVETGESEHLL